MLDEIVKIGKISKSNSIKQRMREIYNEVEYHIACLDNENVTNIVDMFSGRCFKC